MECWVEGLELTESLRAFRWALAKRRPKLAKMKPKMAKMRAKMAKMRPNIGQDEVQVGQDDGQDGQIEAEVWPNALGSNGGGFQRRKGPNTHVFCLPFLGSSP